MVKVWDPFVRLFHWATAIAFLTNFWIIQDGIVHEWLGYGVACLLVSRFVWGWVGSRHARFADFFPTPGRLKRYLGQLLRGRHEPSIGHNPLGGLMIITLMLVLAGITLTGWFMTLDMFWAVAWPEEVHEFLANVAQGLVFIHVAVVLLMDVIFKEGLVRAMITGKKQSIETE